MHTGFYIRRWIQLPFGIKDFSLYTLLYRILHQKMKRNWLSTSKTFLKKYSLDTLLNRILYQKMKRNWLSIAFCYQRFFSRNIHLILCLTTSCTRDFIPEDEKELTFNCLLASKIFHFLLCYTGIYTRRWKGIDFQHQRLSSRNIHLILC